jgi:hypothetical protein
LNEGSTDPEQDLDRSASLSLRVAENDDYLNEIYLFFLLNKLKEVSTSTILKDNPEMVSCLVPVEET